MNPDFWLSRWNENKIGFHQAHINEQLTTFYPRLGLKPGDRIFVPLCGKTKDMIWLRDKGVEVIGVELSDIAARAFFAEHGMQPAITSDERFTHYIARGIEILQGDFFSVRASDLAGAAVVYDRAALIALPPDMRVRYADRMGELVPSGGRMLLVTAEYPPEEMSGPPFTVVEREVRELFGESFTITKLIERDILAVEPRFRERGLSELIEKVYLLVRK